MTDVDPQRAPLVGLSGGDTIPNLVIWDMYAKAERGKVKYGTYLMPFNGRRALVDAYQELIDLLQYTKQAIVEDESVRRAAIVLLAYLDVVGYPDELRESIAVLRNFTIALEGE